MSDFNVGFVIFPDITQLDFTGPFEVLSRLATPPSLSVPSAFAHSRTHIVAKSASRPTRRLINLASRFLPLRRSPGLRLGERDAAAEGLAKNYGRSGARLTACRIGGFQLHILVNGFAPDCMTELREKAADRPQQIALCVGPAEVEDEGRGASVGVRYAARIED